MAGPMSQRFVRSLIFLLPIGLILMFSVSSCDDNNFFTIRYDDIGPFDTTAVPRVTAPNGLIIYFHQEGHGDVLSENQSIRVRYTGRTTNGEIFDSTIQNDVDNPTTLRLQGMIAGFMQGLAGYVDEVDGEKRRVNAAREGSIRTLVIPPDLGYGGSNHQLNADTLIFDIDVVSIASDF